MEDSPGTVVDTGIARTVVVSAVPSSAPLIHDSSPSRDLAHRLAAQSVAALTGAAHIDVTLRSLCRHCGGAHGALSVVSPAGTGATVSLSRAPGRVVAVASLLGPIGVDIESVGRMTRAPVDAVALHPAEINALARLDPAARDRARTLHWTRKESLLKATGFGLRIPPASIHLGGIGVAAPVDGLSVDGTSGAGLSAARRSGAGTGGAGTSVARANGAHPIVRLIDAPNVLWRDLEEGRFSPVFADLGGWEAQHPPSTANDLVGSICVLRAAGSARGANDAQHRGADRGDQQHRHRE